jgi:hypothetical protein
LEVQDKRKSFCHQPLRKKNQEDHGLRKVTETLFQLLATVGGTHLWSQLLRKLS